MRLKSATGGWGRPADLQKRLDMRNRRSGSRFIQNHLRPVAAHLLFRRARSNRLNRHGPDVGTWYRSAMFYVNDDQKRIANAIAQLDTAKVFPARIVTELMPLKGFFRAEDYEHGFLNFLSNIKGGTETSRAKTYGWCSTMRLTPSTRPNAPQTIIRVRP